MIAMDAVDLARIRFVTSRYHDLQGLRGLAILAACLSAFWARPYLELLRDSGTADAALGFFLSFAPWIFVLAIRPFLDHYYRERFGSVAAGFRQWSPDKIGWAVLIAAGLWIDMRTLGSAKPSAILVVGALIAIHIVWRDWPWRPVYVVTAIVCAVAAWLTAVSPALRIDNLDDLLRVSFTIMIAAHTAAGVFDHRLLLRALPRNRDAQADEPIAEHADSV
jgi:hypothetical protein